MSDGSDKHIDGLLRNRTALLGPLLEIAQIIAVTAAEAKQSRPVGQVVEDLCQRHARGPHDGGQCKRVKIADAVIVWQATLRTHAQRIGARVSRLDRTKGAAAP